MGEVYRARDPQLKRDVAIKVITGYTSHDADRLRRFEQEAWAAAALNHPNILSIYQMGTHEGMPYLVTELLEGSTLREELLRGPLASRKAVDYAIQTTRGLAAAHERGIVHRDLKPENLFITKDGRIKILDFGLAKLVQPSQDPDSPAATLSEKTKPGIVLGTVGYMSPEQVRGNSTDHRTDLFAFGAIFYEMLTGQRAFRKPTSAETMSAILNEEPPPVTQIVPAVPPALQKIVNRCLEKSPERRFHSASDLAFALEALSESSSSTTSAVASATSQSKWRWIAAAALIVVVVGALIEWFARPPAVPVIESVNQLTDDGESKEGGLATDGARIYVNEGPFASLRIAQVSVSGGGTAPLPTQLTSPEIAGITQDGSALLVLAGGGYNTAQPLWMLSLPGGATRRLGEMDVTTANMFPDGRIVYTIGSSVYVAEKDGSNPRKLAEIPFLGAVGASVSPDGGRIVFSSIIGFQQFGPTYEMDADGSHLHEVMKGGQNGLPSNICCARWTPDGTHLAFGGFEHGRWDLWVLPDHRSFLHGPPQPVRLTNGPISYGAGTISRDGKQIFAIGMKRRGELVRYDPKLHDFAPYLGGISALGITFSRDGKWAAYVSYPDHALWRSRADGSERLQLTFPPQVAIEPRISADGTRVAYHGPDNVAYVISMNGGTPRKLSDNGQAPDWSPDGNLLAVTSTVSGKRLGEKGSTEARIIDLRSGNVSIVPKSQGKAGPWFVTQDVLLAASEDSSKFFLFDFKSGTWSDLAEDPSTFPAWTMSPDGKYLYCTTAGNEPKALRIRIADHSVENIVSLKNFRNASDPDEGIDIGIAPDGSALLTRDVGTQEVYSLTVKWR
jgi:serine/threonine protein kinase/Tol biopolymer transport system component